MRVIGMDIHRAFAEAVRASSGIACCTRAANLYRWAFPPEWGAQCTALAAAPVPA